MATKKAAASAAPKPEPAPEETDAAPTAPVENLIAVVAAKAFLGPTGWVQPGETTHVTAARKQDLARNGLLQGETASNDDAVPLGETRDTTRNLTVTGAAADQTKDQA